MNQENFEQYVKERYTRQVDWYDGKATENQKKYRVMQWSIIVLAALTPVLIELRLRGSYGHLPTATSAVVAIVTAGLKTFKYQENWINYRTTCETLRKEYHYYNAVIGEYQELERGEKRRGLFVSRVESLISRENTMWLTGQRNDQRGSTKHDEAEKRSVRRDRRDR